LVLAVISALAFMSGRGWHSMDSETIQGGIALVMGIAATSVALSLDGLACRGRYRPAVHYLWLVLWLAVAWVGFAALFNVVALRNMGLEIPWIKVIAFALVSAALNFVVLLPFLILSSASGFYRERLNALLHVKPEAFPPTPVTAPEMEVMAK
jgi:hypothetical protein